MLEPRICQAPNDPPATHNLPPAAAKATNLFGDTPQSGKGLVFCTPSQLRGEVGDD
jgi:hypothetical protein